MFGCFLKLECVLCYVCCLLLYCLDLLLVLIIMVCFSLSFLFLDVISCWCYVVGLCLNVGLCGCAVGSVLYM